jgi:NitT/TauT family transport system ATP-binding protein
MNLITINNLSKSYYSIKEETKVLDNISFNVKEHEHLGIIGPSGCGKSSLLNIISKLDKDYNGKIQYKDNLIIGYMFQNDLLFDHLTIYENCILGLKIKNILKETNKEYVKYLLKKYNLYKYKNKYPNELSGGMRQRVSLIRTLAIKPDLLLLDEAFSALDYQTRINVRNDVMRIINEEKKAFIIVTHDLEEALEICDTIIVLSKIPSKIINTYKIDKNNIKEYYNLIWKDLQN